MKVSKETELIQRIDRVFSQIIGKCHWAQNVKCNACGKENRAGVTDEAGHTLCADCYNLSEQTSSGIPAQPPTHHPQGDQLLSLPMRPKFVKKFSQK